MCSSKLNSICFKILRGSFLGKFAGLLHQAMLNERRASKKNKIQLAPNWLRRYTRIFDVACIPRTRPECQAHQYRLTKATFITHKFKFDTFKVCGQRKVDRCISSLTCARRATWKFDLSKSRHRGGGRHVQVE